MIEMTASGRQRLDEYLLKLRAALRRLGPAEAEDLEQSVREHVEVALAGIPAPIGAEQVSTVLDRLGAPERWVPQSDQPIWRTVMERLRTGPEEWRLAYVTFGLFAFGLILTPVGIGVFVLLLSFLASRAYVEMMKSKSEPLGARRWLVYPPIALFMVFGVMLTIIGPAGAFVAWGVGDHELHRLLEISVGSSDILHARFDLGAAAVIFGAWWVLSSTVAVIFLPVLRFAFVPLLDRLQRRHIFVLTAIGIVTATLGAWILDPFWAWAF